MGFVNGDDFQPKIDIAVAAPNSWRILLAPVGVLSDREALIFQ
jgi:hypothetical protein